MAIRLITRGDDIGSFESANRAIIDAHKNGILKNTSIMVPGPAFAHAAELLNGERGLCVGLHLTLTAEWDAPRWGPVAPRERVRSLIDQDGCFLSDPMKIHQRGVNLDECMIEAQAQLDAARAAGLNIEYVDEHMGVAWIHPEGKPDARLSGRLKEWCKKEGLIWHLDVTEDLPPAKQKGLPFADEFLQRIEQAGAGTYLLISHPAYDTPEMQSVSGSGCKRGTLGTAREADYRLLCDATFSQALQKKGVEIVTYKQAA